MIKVSLRSIIDILKEATSSELNCISYVDTLCAVQDRQGSEGRVVLEDFMYDVWDL